MNHLGFIAASYAVALGGILGLFGASFVAMRRAERRAAALRKERRG
jgi:hypothetical protein